mmetsp:Transcript_26465/g.76948  ORF Transcript_26465/g.76948 Transcript_26465/m.76948 type:complete len:206 (+) Transcript_26465:441-1058(+)
MLSCNPCACAPCAFLVRSAMVRTRHSRTAAVTWYLASPRCNLSPTATRTARHLTAKPLYAGSGWRSACAACCRAVTTASDSASASRRRIAALALACAGLALIRADALLELGRSSRSRPLSATARGRCGGRSTDDGSSSGSADEGGGGGGGGKPADKEGFLERMRKNFESRRQHAVKVDGGAQPLLLADHDGSSSSAQDSVQHART